MASKSRFKNFLFGKDSKRMDCLVSSVFKTVFGSVGGCNFSIFFDVKPMKTLKDSKYTKISFNRCQEKNILVVNLFCNFGYNLNSDF